MKKLFLLLLPLLLSGCAANYNLDISSEAVKEDISFTIPKSAVSAESLSYQINNRKVYSDSNKYYKMTQNEDNQNYYIKYNYDHALNDFGNSFLLKKCYSNYTWTTNDDKIALSTTDEFLCIYMEDGFQMDSVQVNIKTDLPVINHNADEVNYETYIWKINKNNYQKKPVNIEIEKNDADSIDKANETTNTNETKKDVADKVTKEIEENKSQVEIFIVFGAIALIISLVSLFLWFKVRKNNKI